MDFLSITIGILLGILTIIPGFHPNLITQFLDYFGFANIEIVVMLVFINSVLDYYQTILFAPDEETALAYSPIMRILKKGELKWVLNFLKFSIISGVFWFLGFLYLIDIFFNIVNNLKRVLIFILPFYITLLIVREKNKLESSFIFILSGLFGIFVINYLKNPLYSILSGIFGVSNLIIKERVSKIKEIELYGFPVTKKYFIFSSFLGFLAVLFMNAFPALTPSQVAFLLMFLDDYGKIIAMMNLSIIDPLISLYLLNKFNKSRIGAFEIVKSNFSYNFIFLLSLSIFSMVLAFYIGKFLIKFDFSKFNIFIIFLIFLIQILIEFKGLPFLFISTLIGILTDKLKVKKGFCMGSLIIPTILYFI